MTKEENWLALLQVGWRPCERETVTPVPKHQSEGEMMSALESHEGHSAWWEVRNTEKVESLYCLTQVGELALWS